MTDELFMEVKGAKIHYHDIGSGDPVLFLHGIPTSSYLWRKVIPIIADNARCIAPDLIGSGKSDKPNLEYNLFDYLEYIETFIDNLSLNNITLVLHGFGSAIGFNYAKRHPEKIKGIAFYEAHVRPLQQADMLSLPMQQVLHPLNQDLDNAYHVVTKDNGFVTNWFNCASLRKLGDEELDSYHQPFVDNRARRPVWQYIQDFSLTKEFTHPVQQNINSYSEWLKSSPIPKLMLFSMPGFMTTMDTVTWCNDNLANLQVVDLEDGMHLAPEENPQLFGQLLKDWYLSL